MPHRTTTGAIRRSALALLLIVPRLASAQATDSATLDTPPAAAPVAVLTAPPRYQPGRVAVSDPATATAARVMRRHDEGLHFSHPIFTESVSPDTKLRVDADRSWAGDGTESELGIEGEYAFDRSFSIEVELPYGFLDPNDANSTSGLGNLEATLKFANFAFEDHGVLLGYGLSVGFPTGDATAGTGSDHIWDLEPFLNIGIKAGKAELVSWGRFGIPTRQRTGEEVGTDFGYDLSALYHFSWRVEGLLELNGSTGLSGPEAGQNATQVAAGIKVTPLTYVPLVVGIGVAVPVTWSDRNAALRLSFFRHF